MNRLPSFKLWRGLASPRKRALLWVCVSNVGSVYIEPYMLLVQSSLTLLSIDNTPRPITDEGKAKSSPRKQTSHARRHTHDIDKLGNVSTGDLTAYVPECSHL